MPLLPVSSCSSAASGALGSSCCCGGGAPSSSRAAPLLRGYAAVYKPAAVVLEDFHHADSARGALWGLGVRCDPGPLHGGPGGSPPGGGSAAGGGHPDPALILALLPPTAAPQPPPPEAEAAGLWGLGGGAEEGCDQPMHPAADLEPPGCALGDTAAHVVRLPGPRAVREAQKKAKVTFGKSPSRLLLLNPFKATPSSMSSSSITSRMPSSILDPPPPPP